MNSIQAKSYIGILKNGLKNIVAVNLHTEWQQQKSFIYSEVNNILSNIPGFSYRLVPEHGILFIDRRDIEDEMPEIELSEFRSLIRAYSILVTTTRYSDNYQFLAKRTKILQILNKPQHSVRSSNESMAVNIRYESIYNLSKKSVETYINIIKGISEFKRRDRARVIAIMRDRGSKADYVQMFEYEKQQIKLYVKTHKDLGTWFDSIYLNWILCEIENDITKLPKYNQYLFSILEKGTFIVILKENYFECYGCCMSLYSLLDKALILHEENIWHVISTTRIKILNLALLSSLMYLNYHKQKNPVYDAEISSSFARIFDRFRSDMPAILVELGNFGVQYWYYYCWGMYNAMNSIPIEFGTKDDYKKSSLMMQQNGTVVGVTNDPLDASWNEAINNGRILSGAIYERLITNAKDNVYSFTSEDIENVNKLIECFDKKCLEIPGLNNVRCIERFYQVEPYQIFGKISQPYFAPRIYYGKLIDNIGNSSKLTPTIEKKDDGFCVNIFNCHISPSFSEHFSYREFENSYITSISIVTNNLYNIKYIKITGTHLYPVKKDIQHSNLFFGIPCMVTTGMSGSHVIDTLFLMVGTINDCQHGNAELPSNINRTRTPIPNALINKLDKDSILDWSNSTWEDYLELIQLSIPDTILNKSDKDSTLDCKNSACEDNIESNQLSNPISKQLNELYDLVKEYQSDIKHYYEELGYNHIPFRVYFDLIKDPCLIYFIDYLKKGPTIKAEAFRIVAEFNKGYQALRSIGLIKSIEDCSSISDFQLIIDNKTEISEYHFAILREEEEEIRRKQNEEYNILRNQIKEVIVLYPKGYKACLDLGLIKDFENCRTTDDLKSIAFRKDVIIAQNTEILKLEQIAEEKRQYTLLQLARSEVQSLKLNYGKGYNYYLSSGHIIQPEACISINDCQRILNYSKQILIKHKELLEKERQEKRHEEQSKRLQAEKERLQAEEQKRIAALSQSIKSDSSQICKILDENNVSCFYHFTDRRNIESIKKHGGLYSWYYLKSHNIQIPNQGGNSFSESRDTKFGLQDFVRLSFCEDHPMAFRKEQEGADLVILKISTDVALFESTLFTDSNAASNSFQKGTNASALHMVNFRATKTKYMRHDDPDFGHKQAEILVKTFLPAKYILNLNEI